MGANFDPEEDFTYLARTAMDTLDFTSFQMNLGSKMILKRDREIRSSTLIEGLPPAFADDQ